MPRLAAAGVGAWWSDLLIISAGGRLIHDGAQVVLCRQHRCNRAGGNDNLPAILARLSRPG